MECSVYTVCAGPPLLVSLPLKSCAEDVVIAACRELRVAPITRTLYALRDHATGLFLGDASPVQSGVEYDLRIRFKVSNPQLLCSLDSTTYDYYFKQARNDVVDNCVSEIQYALHKKEMMGLGIADMYRAIQEENKSLQDVKQNYKKYIPKVIIKKHQFFTKKPVHNVLEQWCKTPPQSPHLIKESYLDQLSRLAPNYLAEDYAVQYQSFAGSVTPGRLHVMPFHETQPGLRVHDHLHDKWIHVCTMEQLIFLGRKSRDTEVEVCRKNGSPVLFRFVSGSQASAFVSAASGYYRLMVKWTIDLSKDDPTPSLQRLYAMKCHGPVGGEFSYHKLDEKVGKRHGSFILRQCQQDYDVYYIDYCTENRTCKTSKLEFKGTCFILNSDDSRPYSSIEHLIRTHNDPAGDIYLKQCIPPSEFDKSQLLLCGQQYRAGVRIDQAELQEMLKHHKSPRCINTRDVLIFKGSQIRGLDGITATYKAIWKLDSNKKMEIALKTLVREKTDSHLKDFIELANKWASVTSSCVVRLYGVTLMSPSALVMEYLQYGPLSVYLSQNRDLKLGQLLTAAAGLARALLDLSEAGYVHGRLRCAKVLLAACDRDQLTVKLSDPGLHSYTDQDIHWIPVEHFPEPEQARASPAADVWAFGTTLWEMFSHGLSPVDHNPQFCQKAYLQGHHLPCPSQCPADVWLVVRRCWEHDPHQRAIPQLIMRDIFYLLGDKVTINDHYSTIDTSIDISGNLETGTVASEQVFDDKKTDNGSYTSDITANSNLSLPSSIASMTEQERVERFATHAAGAAMCDLDVHSMQWILGMGPRTTVTLQNKIGSGNYGEVYKGFLEKESVKQCLPVAVKKLKSDGKPGVIEDFKKEIEVMKLLQHPNIVQILGVCVEREMLIVMQYLEHGSLSTYLRIYQHSLTLHNLLQYAQDVASGMEYLSAKHVVHRDLAARNILVKNERHVLISDFGLARFTTDNDKYRMTTLRDMPIKWFSPEAVQGEFSSASDVWSYGVTLWEMFTYGSRDVPVFDQSKPTQRADCFDLPADCPVEVWRQLMQPCWRLHPADRPKFIKLVHVCRQLTLQY